MNADPQVNDLSPASRLLYSTRKYPRCIRKIIDPSQHAQRIKKHTRPDRLDAPQCQLFENSTVFINTFYYFYARGCVKIPARQEKIRYFCKRSPEGQKIPSHRRPGLMTLSRSTVSRDYRRKRETRGNVKRKLITFHIYPF